MSDTNVNNQPKPQEFEIERLEESRRKWRKAALVFGWLALANVPLALVALASGPLLFDYTFGFSIGWAIVAYAIFSTIPYALIALVCMGTALSRKRDAASIRRLQQTN